MSQWESVKVVYYNTRRADDTGKKKKNEKLPEEEEEREEGGLRDWGLWRWSIWDDNQTDTQKCVIVSVLPVATSSCCQGEWEGGEAVRNCDQIERKNENENENWNGGEHAR